MPLMRLELATPGLQTQRSSHWAIQLKSYIWKELSLSSWCIASLYIYHFSTVIDFSSQKTSREIYSEDADGEIQTRNPWITNPVF